MTLSLAAFDPTAMDHAYKALHCQGKKSQKPACNQSDSRTNIQIPARTKFLAEIQVVFTPSVPVQQQQSTCCGGSLICFQSLARLGYTSTHPIWHWFGFKVWQNPFITKIPGGCFWSKSCPRGIIGMPILLNTCDKIPPTGLLLLKKSRRVFRANLAHVCFSVLPPFFSVYFGCIFF